ncbi:hypothetical protein HY634_03875 [Candidatus Uhrbacteria bacterium]|nr:hypothetical protein [Candidatus Uhrbacteria bacterium]
MNDLSCRMCEAAQRTNGAVGTLCYRKYGKVVALPASVLRELLFDLQ